MSKVTNIKEIEGAAQVNNNTVLYYEELDLGNGFKLVAEIDFNTIQDNISLYTDALRASRGIPSSIEDLPGMDIAAILAYDKLDMFKDKDVRMEQAVKAAQSYYRQLDKVATDNGALMAVLYKSKIDVSVDPKPHNNVAKPELPGLISFPEPELNLNNPVERLLKQYQDILDDNREFYIKMALKMRNIGADMLERAKTHGTFQS